MSLEHFFFKLSYFVIVGTKHVSGTKHPNNLHPINIEKEYNVGERYYLCICYRFFFFGGGEDFREKITELVGHDSLV